MSIIPLALFAALATPTLVVTDGRGRRPLNGSR